jgi:hypothetical protein
VYDEAKFIEVASRDHPDRGAIEIRTTRISQIYLAITQTVRAARPILGAPLRPPGRQSTRRERARAPPPSASEATRSKWWRAGGYWKIPGDRGVDGDCNLWGATRSLAALLALGEFWASSEQQVAGSLLIGLLPLPLRPGLTSPWCGAKLAY